MAQFESYILQSKGSHYFGSLELSYHWQHYHTSTFFHVAAILDFAIDTLKVLSPIGLKCGVLLQVKGLFLGERTHDMAKNIHTYPQRTESHTIDWSKEKVSKRFCIKAAIAHA